MGIKKYYATKDNTITNAFRESLNASGNLSNMGGADVLEVFSIYGQTSASIDGYSSELTRILIQFDIDQVKKDREDGLIPLSGTTDLKFYLNMYNARHSETLPEDFTLTISAVSRSWTEGTGLDMHNYKDLDPSGSNWLSSSKSVTWTRAGGDYHRRPTTDAFFKLGTEDLNCDVTDFVEQWIKGPVPGSNSGRNNYGFGIRLTSSLEAYYSSSISKPGPGMMDNKGRLHNLTGSKRSYYTKKFFSRSSEFFFKRPTLEARWDSRVTDDRGSFFKSSPMVHKSDNFNKLYLYNRFRGKLKDIKNLTKTVFTPSEFKVGIYSGSGHPTTLVAGPFTVGKLTKAPKLPGIYTASVFLSASSTATTIWDVWTSGSTIIKTGTISVKSHDAVESLDQSEYITTITNLRSVYTPEEVARFRLYIRNRNWNPSIYTRARRNPENTIVSSGSFEIYRIIDNLKIIAHATGTNIYSEQRDIKTRHTYLSYDNSGSFFDLDMSMLEPGYAYGIRLAYFDADKWVNQTDIFKFRVE
tara:strand:+ start:417 stop:1994 length:1578 start_codon:yes stop_codon:yes gene_type:complete